MLTFCHPSIPVSVSSCLPSQYATGEWIENLTLAQTRERLKHNVSTFEEMLQEKALSESNVHLYIDMKHTEIVRPVLHAVMQAVDRWGWTADRLVVATFRQLDLLQVRATDKGR